MILHRRFDNCPELAAGSVVTIGNYDGVHRGHQALLQLVCKEATRRNLASCVMTFDPMPNEFFQPEVGPGRLTTWRERYLAIAREGMDVMYQVPFDRDFANLSVQEFVVDVLLVKLNVKVLYVGDDFRFGRQRAGGVAELREFGQEFNFDVEQMASQRVDQNRISSSAIREALLASKLEHAQTLLGRPYSMSGRVVHGQKLGRTLGFPTANIRPRRNSLPMTGIFAVRARGAALEGIVDGVANLGFRPTVGGGDALLEVHLFDYDGDLYGTRLDIDFVEKLREEEHFADLDLMVEQMHRDATNARAILEAAAGPMEPSA